MTVEVASSPIDTLKVFVTAEEAYPEFERLFLAASSLIQCGFRVFDLDTRLRSQEGRAIGMTWFDLFEHTLKRGVSITVVISDFDPIVGTDLHRKSWETAQQLSSVDEVTGRGTLSFRIARHPARAGIVPRLLFRNRVRARFLERDADQYTPGLNDVSPGDVFDLSPVTHHQKMAVFDETTLYIGGLDLDERRFDTKDHDQAAEETWQDVQVVVTGPVVAAAVHHLETFEDVVASRRAPAARADGFLRTLSARRRFAPFHISPRAVVSEIEDMHIDATGRARCLIYLETQFFRHLPLADSLAAAGSANRELHLIMVLPAAPEDVAFNRSDSADAKMGEHLQAEAIQRVRQAFGTRALFCSPAQKRGEGARRDRSTHLAAPIIYVHSKVSIFDDGEAIVSSANLNGRSLKWDTEAGVHLTRVEHIRELRERLFRHWMPPLAIRDVSDASRILSEWRATLVHNAMTAPEERLSFLLPYDETEAREFGENIAVVPNELV